MDDREVTFGACGRSWTLRYTQRARRAMEKSHGITVANIFEKLLSFDVAPHIILAGLEGKRWKDDQKAPVFTIQQVDAIFDELGHLPVTEFAAAAIQSGLRAPEAPKEESGPPEPPKAPAEGTPPPA